MTAPQERAATLSLDAMYSAVAARRTSFDSLLWQVPSLVLTAQAFLFTIMLAPGTSRTGRLIAAGLSVGMSGFCSFLVARHRQAEITDAKWLEAMEHDHGPRVRGVHGEPWRRARNAQSGVWKPFHWWRGHVVAHVFTWSFAVASLATVVLEVAEPSLLR